MDLRPRFFGRFMLIGLTVLGVATMSAGMASARTEILRWTHPDSGQVVSWEAHVGSTQGSYDQVIQFSAPQVDANGVLEASIVVSDDAVVFIALRAIGQNGEQSVLSNERERGPSDSGDGGAGNTPPDPPILIQVVPIAP